MLLHLLALLFLVQLAQADPTNSTTPGCPSPDATACNYRSVLSILGSCATTLLVCVWHAIHPNVPPLFFKWWHVFLYRLCLTLVAFITPEVMVGLACYERFKASEITERAQSHFKWWTDTHSYLMLMGGFFLCDDKGTNEIDFETFLSLANAEKIVNPVVMESDIDGTDYIGKAIYFWQLLWFMIQIFARIGYGLTVTLVELDTACMALFTLVLIYLWRKKPLCPGRPHFFYTRNARDSCIEEMSQRGGNPNEWQDYYRTSVLKFVTTGKDRHSVIPLWITWFTFGAIHALFWNYEFPASWKNANEVWRVASLLLAGLSVLSAVVCILGKLMGFHGTETRQSHTDPWVWVTYALLICGIICRLILVGLMLGSLSSLPYSAHQVIPWTDYVPHL